MFRCQILTLTLITRLASQDLPELFGGVVVRVVALLDDLDVVRTATQISFALDEVGQL